MPRRFRNTRRENRLEELGRVDAEKAYTSKGKRNLRDEKHRIRKELKEGGRSSGWPKGGPSRPSNKPLPSPGRPSRKIPKHLRDKLKDLTKKGRPSPGRPGGKGPKPDKRWNKGDKFMTPLKGGGRPAPSRLRKAQLNPSKPSGATRRPKAGPSGKEVKPVITLKMKTGGRTKGPNRPRPQGPHMWVRGDKRKKYAVGSIVKGAIKGAKKFKKTIKGLGSGIKPSEAKEVLKTPGKSWKKTRSQYLKEHSPHFGGTRKKYASGGIVMAGKKVGCQIK